MPTKAPYILGYLRIYRVIAYTERNKYCRLNKRKTKDYLHHKYKVVAVLPNEQLYQKAVKYLSKEVNMVKYSGLDKFVATSLKKVPNKESFPLTEKANARNGFAHESSSFSTSWGCKRYGEFCNICPLTEVCWSYEKGSVAESRGVDRDQGFFVSRSQSDMDRFILRTCTQWPCHSNNVYSEEKSNEC